MMFSQRVSGTFTPLGRPSTAHASGWAGTVSRLRTVRARMSKARSGASIRQAKLRISAQAGLAWLQAARAWMICWTSGNVASIGCGTLLSKPGARPGWFV